MPTRDKIRAPEYGTDAIVEAASDGRVYLTLADANCTGYQIAMSATEADQLAANLADKAAMVRDFIRGN